MFEYIGTDGDCISETWKRFFKEFLLQMGYEMQSETDYEIYFEKKKRGVFCELCVPVIKK